MRTLIINTFQKEWRSKSLLTLIVLTIFFLIVSTSLLDFMVNSFLAKNEVLGAGSTAFTLFLILVGIWSSFVVSLIGAGVVKDDFDYQVLPQILSLPISRAKYLAARLIGTWALLFAYFLLTYAFAATLFQMVSGENVWHFGVVMASLTYAIRIIPILLFSCLFSLFLPKIFSFVFTLILMAIVSAMNSSLMTQSYSKFLETPSIFRYLCVVVDAIFPRMGFWANVTDILLSGDTSGLADISFFSQSAHFILTSAFWIFVLHYFFSRKEV